MKPPYILDFVDSYENYQGITITRADFTYTINEQFSENTRERLTYDRGHAFWFTGGNYVDSEAMKQALATLYKQEATEADE